MFPDFYPCLFIFRKRSTTRLKKSACPSCLVGPEDRTGVCPEDRTGVGLEDRTGVGPEDRTGVGPEDRTGVASGADTVVVELLPFSQSH